MRLGPELSRVSGSAAHRREIRQDPERWAEEYPAWRGCHLIVDDDTLGSDLTGFQAIEDERLPALLATLAPKVEVTKAYLAEGRSLLVGQLNSHLGSDAL